MSTKGLLIIIAVILLGILGVMALDSSQETPAEEIAGSFSEITEEIGDEIDDNTDAN